MGDRHGKPKIIKKCRACGSCFLKKVLFLGNQYVSDFVRSSREGFKAPLDVVICEECSLVQLRHTAVNPNKLYRNYWYKSGVNQTMRDALKNIVMAAEKLVSLKTGDVVLDIGANDGTLLRAYSGRGIIRVGFEPARNLTEEAKAGTDKIFVDFFKAEHYLTGIKKRAKVITAIAMFYDLEDPNTFVSDVVKCLMPGGIFIIQMASQPLMLELNAFDNICHEHIEYYSMKSLVNLLERHNLEVFDVELNNVNGGSFRTYIKHNGDKNIGNYLRGRRRIKDLLEKEEYNKANLPESYMRFARRVEKLKKKTVSFITDVVHKGKNVYVYGASTKGNTLLQYFGLDHNLIKGAAERNPNKWGLKTVGTLIPIISEEEARAAKPDYFLVLPWHFKKEFLEREREYLMNGGRMIFPLPKFEVIGREYFAKKLTASLHLEITSPSIDPISIGPVKFILPINEKRNNPTKREN